MFDTLTNSFKGAIDKIRFYDDEKALKKALTVKLVPYGHILINIFTSTETLNYKIFEWENDKNNKVFKDDITIKEIMNYLENSRVFL